MEFFLFQTVTPTADLGFNLSGPAACIIYMHYMGYCYCRITDTAVPIAGPRS
eukprot:SAG11_NODE_1903_length_4090_cov_9.110805_4_plen_52_part_00